MEKNLVIYAGDINTMRKLTLFGSLEEFNMYYRRLKLTIKSDLRPSWERILKVLFEASFGMNGVTFFRRMTLAEKAECGKTSLDEFMKYAKEQGFLRIERALSPKEGKKKRGGDAHLVYIFQPIEGTLDLPCEGVMESEREPSREPLNGNRKEVEKPCETKKEGSIVESLSSFSFCKNPKTKENNTYISKASFEKITTPVLNQIEIQKIERSEVTSDHDLVSQYEHNPEKYAAAKGVPQEIINELKNGLSTSQIISIWIGMRRTLDKYKANYSRYIDAAQKAIGQAIGIYRAKKYTLEAPFNWTALICGKLKIGIREELADMLREHYKKRQNGIYDWLTAPSNEEMVTASLIGVINLLVTDSEQLPF